MIVECETCGKPVSQYPAYVKAAAHHFCSRQCSGKWKSIHQRGQARGPRQGTVLLLCDHCGQEHSVQAARLKASKLHFCDHECQNAYAASHRPHNWGGGSASVPCPVCGKDRLYKYPSHARKARSSPCRKCSLANLGHLRRVPRIEVRCEQCGKEMLVVPAQAKARRFCGYACRGAWRREHWTGENCPNSKAKVEVRCEQCGKVEKVSPQRAAMPYRFCSQRCRGLWMSENLRGERAPRWKGGISPERDKWYGNGGRKWCRAVKREQCYTCAVCGKVHASRSTQIVVHHKAGYTAYEELRSEPRNGLCVCRSCHFWLHSNAGRAQREAWEREALRELGHLLIAADEAA